MRINLPQCEIFFPQKDDAEKFLLIAGGRQPDKNWFVEVAKDKKIFAIDKGVELCRECDLLPSFVVGDFDSAKKSAVDWAAEKKIPVERHPVDKDFTDTQLALRRLESFGEKNFALVTGIFGGRFDHLFSNIFSCAAAKIQTCLADEEEIIFYLRGGESAEIKFFRKPLAVSLLPITETCGGVKISGVHWELDGAELFQKLPNAVSNRIESDEIKISVETGTLAVYFCYAEGARCQM